jgi:hypothetical protein
MEKNRSTLVNKPGQQTPIDQQGQHWSTRPYKPLIALNKKAVDWSTKQVNSQLLTTPPL